MGTTDDLEALRQSINSGAISTLPTSRLEQFLVALCHSQAYTLFGEREYPQICETVRLHLLRSHITGLNEKNALTQKLVIALTVASLIGTAIQTYVAVWPQTRPTASLLQKQETQSSVPSQTKPPSSHPSVSKP